MRFKRKEKMEGKDRKQENLPEEELESVNNSEQPSEDTKDEQQLGEKLLEINDKYLRLYSEFDNYRKRTIKEKADLIKYASEDVIKALLPVVDDLERALKAIDANEKEVDAADATGIRLIYNKFMGILERQGLKSIEAKGNKFDEEYHEAVTKFPAASEDQKGTVIDEIEKGYMLNDKVIRYAKVVVAI